MAIPQKLRDVHSEHRLALQSFPIPGLLSTSHAPAMLLFQETPDWELAVPFDLNALCVGPVFRSTSNRLLLSSADGRVYVYNKTQVYLLFSSTPKFLQNIEQYFLYLIAQQEKILETKGGPVFHMVLFDILGFGSLDLTVGDSEGNITFISGRCLLHLLRFCSGLIHSLLWYHRTKLLKMAKFCIVSHFRPLYPL
jgi:hypothetical protein